MNAMDNFWEKRHLSHGREEFQSSLFIFLVLKLAITEGTRTHEDAIDATIITDPPSCVHYSLPLSPGTMILEGWGENENDGMMREWRKKNKDNKEITKNDGYLGKWEWIRGRTSGRSWATQNGSTVSQINAENLPIIKDHEIAYGTTAVRGIGGRKREEREWKRRSGVVTELIK